ncbi:uncharacterized protein LOC124309500 [Neodiprion virginianus]|uniref:uncharacterized protein LOC124309500 n=1 Tax=Neodiprion virginianus TaxID=2961670 RepID=UPI001EE6EBD3|nr:uncharacterized protein LOC124309500 [Neodiprion virginianus]
MESWDDYGHKEASMLFSNKSEWIETRLFIWNQENKMENIEYQKTLQNFLQEVDVGHPNCRPGVPRDPYYRMDTANHFLPTSLFEELVKRSVSVLNFLSIRAVAKYRRMLQAKLTETTPEVIQCLKATTANKYR